MNVASLGFSTDLALLVRAGSTVEDCGDHLVVRSPYNPMFYWGNFLLLNHVPAADRIDEWLERFASTLPGATHRAFGFDCPGTVDDLSDWAGREFKAEASTVMTAMAVHPPARPNDEATYRALQSDDDWAQSLELQLACHDGGDESHRAFATLRTESNRALAAGGPGEWFGAFAGDRLVSQMGLVGTTPDVARFQSVETHPAFRERGLAGTLVHFVSRYGFGELGARTLVLVADPDYAAIRIYRAVGFTARESNFSAERVPGREP